MTCHIYKFNFDRSIQPQDLEETLMLSVLAAESLHGPALVQMECRFLLEKDSHRCTIYGASPVGRDLAMLFTGFATREYGESAIQIECLSTDDDSSKTDTDLKDLRKQEVAA